MKKDYFVYLLADQAHQLLRIGITDNLYRKMYQPRVRRKMRARQSDMKLVYFEQYPEALTVVVREKQFRNMTQAELSNLVSHWNPTWENLQPQSVPKSML